MDTVRLSAAFPAAWQRVNIARFDGVQNGAALKDALIAASRTPDGSAERRRMDYAFVDARLLASRRHLVSAVVQSIVAAERLQREEEGAAESAPRAVGLKTPSIHSEVLWTLNPNNNVRTAWCRA